MVGRQTVVPLKAIQEKNLSLAKHDGQECNL